jgi:hypothetical protein
MHDELDMFGAPSTKEACTTPLAGLTVQMPSACPCGSAVATIEPGRGPHLAGLRCTHCDRHRGWMSRETHRFVTEIAAKFGRPSGRIVVRTRDSAPPDASTDTETETASTTERN